MVAFSKAKLAPGESVRVSMRVDERAFRFWDTHEHRWRIDEGLYNVLFCASSRDVRLTCDVFLGAGEGQSPFPVDSARSCAPKREALASYYEVVPGGFSDAAFVALYGAPLPPRRPVKPFTPDSPVSRLVRRFSGGRRFVSLIS